MKPERKLIEKFLQDQCTRDEAEIISQFFLSHPEAIETGIPLADMLEDQKKLLKIDISGKILNNVRKNYAQPQRTKPVRYLSRYGIAASVIGLVFLFGQLLFDRGKSPDANSMTALKAPVGPAQVMDVIDNKTTEIIQATLADGSLVSVYPKSSLQMAADFGRTRRDLYLKGKALFKVSKDASRPFTVFSSGIATTALGTQFLVSEIDDAKNVSVRLLEGSVKVWPQFSRDQKRCVILKPGDRLLVNAGYFDEYSLASLPRKVVATKTSEEPAAGKAVGERKSLLFKNDVLSDVFLQLEKRFNVTINFNIESREDQKLFTGKFLDTDDLEFVCRTICRLHGLIYKIDGTTVTISAP